MCKLKAALILKDRVFIPEYDSHSDMLAELGIEDTRANAERLFVRAELSPRNGDVFTPIDEWEFTVDQDIRPEWFVEGYDKERMTAAVKEWAKSHIHVGVDELEISTGSNHCIKDCKNVRICDSASVECIGGSASVKYIGDSASVKYIGGSASVECIDDSASVKYIYDSASVECIDDSASVECIGGSASVEFIGDSASVEYICDSASVEFIGDSASVKSICGSASVESICGSASVKSICGSASVESIGGSAVASGSLFGWTNKDKVILSDNATFRDCESKIIYQAGDWELRLVPAKEATT